MSSENISFNKVKTLKKTNHSFSNTQTTNKNPMARYRRNFIAGGTFFFTVKLADPKSRLLVEHIGLLRAVYMDVQKQYPFETVAVCVLPNHIHTIWTLPLDDADYSLRWRLIKTKFSAHFPHAENLSAARTRYLATAFLRTHRARRNGFAALRGLHPFQSRQTWIVRQCPRLAVFVVSPLCAGWMAAVRLGRHKRNGSNEFWGMNAL